MIPPSARPWRSTKKQSAKRVVNTASGMPVMAVALPAFLTLVTRKSINRALSRMAENMGSTPMDESG